MIINTLLSLTRLISKILYSIKNIMQIAILFIFIYFIYIVYNSWIFEKINIIIDKFSNIPI